MAILRRVPLTYDPSPAEVLDPAELARARRWQHLYRTATYWSLNLAEVKRLMLLRWLRVRGRLES